MKESCAYTLDANGGILTMAQADGSARVYGYDNRYRLTSAALRNSLTLLSPCLGASV